MALLLPDPTAVEPVLPQPRGRASEQLLCRIQRPVHEVGDLVLPADDPLDGDDFHLCLHLTYGLHHRGFDGVDERWEWEPSLLAFRRRLESAFELRLVEELGLPEVGLSTADIQDRLDQLAAGDADAASLSAFLATDGTIDQLREFAVHRSIYQRKEADPHTWVVPRLPAAAKAAVVEVQWGEYGAGDPEELHAELFARTMLGLDLDPTYGRYIDAVPGVTLATDNLVVLFGLHRRWRGACIGHLALFEMASVIPMGRYCDALLRLTGDVAAARFYAAHVEADALHERIARDRMVPALLAHEPTIGGEVLFGARALVLVERRFSDTLLGAWQRGASSLRQPLDPSGVGPAAPG